ncbi:DMT family transporter [Lelliottia wanjuensis]|uniref:Threonine/homoserine exporter RhtA n=1 Tax=Lelliottia wanjuensis TaxID=3050585 RepID=A0AAP4D3E6_9ENTR|nr:MULTISPECIES: DMT family transporter [unclassified Lelliottia]MDK9363278.1 DMT family transporter [Lelliottia sp. V106_12]MDK9616920.1 DMT family transporter [Lelliottia sp. V106_9]
MPYILLTLAAIFWGGNYVAGSILVHYINPYALSIFRWGLTTVLMFTLYWRTIAKEWCLLMSNIKINAIYALLGQITFPLTLYIGLQYTSSLNASIYISSTPCLVLLINALFFHEKISWRNIIGVIVSTAGVIYLAFSNAHSGGLASFGIGDLLTIISAVSWACYCALLRLKDKRVTNTAFVGFTSLIGTIILVPVYFIYCYSAGSLTMFNDTPSLYPVLGAIYLVIFPSWLAYVFWNKGVQLLGTTRSEIFTHIIPISGGLLSIVLLNQEFHFYHFLTLLLIIFGIVLCSGKTSNKAQKV